MDEVLKKDSEQIVKEYQKSGKRETYETEEEFRKARDANQDYKNFWADAQKEVNQHGMMFSGCDFGKFRINRITSIDVKNKTVTLVGNHFSETITVDANSLSKDNYIFTKYQKEELANADIHV